MRPIIPIMTSNDNGRFAITAQDCYQEGTTYDKWGLVSGGVKNWYSFPVASSWWKIQWKTKAIKPLAVSLANAGNQWGAKDFSIYGLVKDREVLLLTGQLPNNTSQKSLFILPKPIFCTGVKLYVSSWDDTAAMMSHFQLYANPVFPPRSLLVTPSIQQSLGVRWC